MEPNNLLNDQLRKMVGQVGSYLRPQKAFTQVNPYDQFAAPQREVFKSFEQGTVRPEFEQNILNPYRRRAANQAAASGSFRMGNFGRNVQSDIGQRETQYANQLDQMRQQYESYIGDLYRDRLSKYYQSPGGFTNF